MMESAFDPCPNACLPYRLMISHTLLASSTDISNFYPLEISSNYGSKIFGSMGYILIDGQQCKKDGAKHKPISFKVTKIFNDPTSIMLIDIENLKACLIILRKLHSLYR